MEIRSLSFDVHLRLHKPNLWSSFFDIPLFFYDNLPVGQQKSILYNQLFLNYFFLRFLKKTFRRGRLHPQFSRFSNYFFMFSKIFPFKKNIFLQSFFTFFIFNGLRLEPVAHSQGVDVAAIDTMGNRPIRYLFHQAIVFCSKYEVVTYKFPLYDLFSLTDEDNEDSLVSQYCLEALRTAEENKMYTNYAWQTYVKRDRLAAFDCY